LNQKRHNTKSEEFRPSLLSSVLCKGEEAFEVAFAEVHGIDMLPPRHLFSTQILFVFVVEAAKVYLVGADVEDKDFFCKHILAKLHRHVKYILQEMKRFQC